MSVYTVHAPVAAPTNRPSSAERFVFVRDGFHVWAFLAGPFWLLYHRLWLALAGYVALNVVATAVLSAAQADAGSRLAVMLLIALLMGLEAASLRRWTLSRRGWRQLDLVVADDEETAERRFFDRWASAPRVEDYRPVERGAPPPTRSPSSLQPDIFGLFPRPGSSR
ncbi:MAG TPA: DUF2628 domain-containing protein [Rhodopseudomonas sp.]|uniref:DUF2628 domain-containing protein n=1 Tax=Rhodopseudomonas sp. TaxID=1078 RepID=UPI002ED92F98